MSVIATAAGESGCDEHQRLAAVAAFAQALVQRHLTEQIGVKVGRQLRASALAERVGALAAAGHTA